MAISNKTGTFQLLFGLSILVSIGIISFSRNREHFNRKAIAIEGITWFPKTFVLKPITDIELPSSASFFLCTSDSENNGNDLACSLGERNQKRVIAKTILDGKTFQIKSTIKSDTTIKNVTIERSESIDSKNNESTLESISNSFNFQAFQWPGDIFWNDGVYLLDNDVNSNTLFKIGDDGVTSKMDLPNSVGDINLAPVPLLGIGVMFIDFNEKKINVCIRDGENLDLTCDPFWKGVEWRHKRHNEKNKMLFYHGGTAGVEVEHGVYVGFGYTSVQDDSQNNHIWHWRLDTRPKSAFMFIDNPEVDGIRGIHIGTNMYPTNLVSVGNEWYLFAAQIEHATLNKKDTSYINRVYKVKKQSCRGFGFCKFRKVKGKWVSTI